MMATEITQELMDELVQMVGEEEALNVIDHAESNTPDPSAYVRKVIERKAKDPEPIESNGFGWSVVECRYMADEENEDGDIEQVERFRGYCLRWKGPTMTFFYGRSLSEWPRMEGVSDPWSASESGRAAAEEMCRRKAELVERSTVRSLRLIRVKAMVTAPVLGESPKRIQKQLTQRQQDALSTMTAAYRQVESSGVKNDSDTIAVLLDNVADLMRLPRDI